MIEMHSRHPAAHRVLLEESPRGEDSRSAHDHFGRECKQGYEVLFAANAAETVDALVSARRFLARHLRAPYMLRPGKGSFHRRS
jgi:hypothetical protein